MRKILYQQPHVIVRVINPEELLQGEGIGVSGTPIGGPDADAKSNGFDDDDEYNYRSDDIWED